jgi:hypothetical protein
MQTLIESQDTFHYEAQFTFVLKDYKGRPSTRTGYIFKDTDKIFLMQKSAMLCSHYSDEQIANRNRLNSMTPVANGDTVLFEGKPHTVKINGDYSDAGALIPQNN